jgi:hypothetical protein
MISAALIACKKGDRVPSYLEVPVITLETASGQGLATSRITDAWVSVDERLLGSWELPARIPILAEGPHRIDIVPAIKRNGMFDDRFRYPFYTTWIGNLDLRREGTVSVSPVVQHQPDINYWIEGFDDTFVRLSTTEASDTTLLRFLPAERPDLPYLGGTPCGGFVLDPANPYIRLYSDEDFGGATGPVFLELDYRNDLAIVVGAIYSQNNVENAFPLVILVPTRRSDGTMPWNKAYIDLSALFNTSVSNRDFYIEARLPSGSSGAQVFLDNIKLVRFGS